MFQQDFPHQFPMNNVSDPQFFLILFIISLLFLVGLILSIKRYKTKKTTNRLMLVFLMILGCLVALGGYVVFFTEIWRVIPLFGSLGIFLFIFSLIILNIKLEKRVEESTKEAQKSEEKYQEVLKERYEKLKEIEELRSYLVRRTSHELKTPLISLFSSTQYLLDTYKDEMSDEVLKFIKIINRGGKRLKNLTDNFLNVYKLESNDIILTKEKIDLARSVKNCAKDLIFSLEERDLYLKEDLNESLMVAVDKTRIEQVILNLLSNAIKNTPSKGIIYLKLEHNNEFVDIIIKDTGIGFTKEEKDRLFIKFGRIDRDKGDSDLDNEGSGLGLYISKEIVELHNGKIIVESEGRNKGSTFIIRLPIQSNS